MSFPIVFLPLEITEPSGRLFLNRWMWLGFGAAGSIGLYNGIAFLYPSIPALPIQAHDMKAMFTAKPWNAIDWFPSTLYPLAIGLGYLLPVDLLFSCVFFFLFWKGQLVVSRMFARDVTPDFPFVKEQAFGAVLALAAFYLYGARRALGESLREAVKGIKPESEGMSSRLAWIGLVAGLFGLIGFCTMAGLALHWSIALIGGYFAFIVVILRIRAELGPPVHDLQFMGPDRALPHMLGTRGMRPTDLSMLTMFWSFNRAHRGDTPPLAMEGQYAAFRRGWSAGGILRAVCIAMVFSTVCSFAMHEHLAYHLGEKSQFSYGSWAGDEAFSKLDGWLAGTADTKPNNMAIGAAGTGALSCLALMLLRLRFIGFPFHPLGYILASSWSIHLLWMPMLIAGIIKGGILRYGGLRAYRLCQPFFLGVILGDVVVGCLWAIGSLVLGVRMYSFFGD